MPSRKEWGFHAHLNMSFNEQNEEVLSSLLPASVSLSNLTLLLIDSHPFSWVNGPWVWLDDLQSILLYIHFLKAHYPILSLLHFLEWLLGEESLMLSFLTQVPRNKVILQFFSNLYIYPIMEIMNRYPHHSFCLKSICPNTCGPKTKGDML